MTLSKCICQNRLRYGAVTSCPRTVSGLGPQKFLTMWMRTFSRMQTKTKCDEADVTSSLILKPGFTFLVCNIALPCEFPNALGWSNLKFTNQVCNNRMPLLSTATIVVYFSPVLCPKRVVKVFLLHVPEGPRLTEAPPSYATTVRVITAGKEAETVTHQLLIHLAWK